MKKLLVIIVGVLLIITLGAYSLYRRSSYEIVHPKRGEITEAVYGLGRVKSNRRFEVILGVVSTVQRVFANEGEKVKKGEPLIQFESGGAFRAPFDGTVTLLAVREGETALPHTPVFRLEDLQDRYIEISLDQQAALRVKAGQRARVSFESLRSKVLEGKLKSIFPRQDEFLAHIEVAGLEPGILPGMTADVTVEVGKIPDAILVPLKTVRNGMVTLKRNGKWTKLNVDVGHIDGMFAEIKGNELKIEDEIRMEKGE